MLKLVARVLKQNRGGHYLSMCKFAYDSNNGTVYIKVTGEEDANLMAGRSFKVAGERMSFYRVLSISVRPVEEDSYQSARCHWIFPFNFFLSSMASSFLRNALKSMGLFMEFSSYVCIN